MQAASEQNRRRAIERYLAGESISGICASLGHSRDWLHRWLKRFETGDPDWFRERSRRPHTSGLRTSSQIEEIVKVVRLSLYNRGEFCGAQAIRWELEEQAVRPLPSLRTINRILVRHGLTHRRTGSYEPKHKRYPKLGAEQPNQVHQTDFVGPCYLRGGLRFYGLNSVDLATGRCATEALLSREAKTTVGAFWSTWSRLGMPRHQQVDNEMVFYGSVRHPRAMGPLIRLCLLNEIEVWFIPLGEPWRNGVVEKFNDVWRGRFLRRVEVASEAELRTRNLEFEARHNARYRYSKLNGRTPDTALKTTAVKLRFPAQSNPPSHPLPRPQTGRYHLVRFVRSEAVLDVFGEQFRAPPESIYEYVRLTVDVARERLQIFLDGQQIDEHPYALS